MNNTIKNIVFSTFSIDNSFISFDVYFLLDNILSICCEQRGLIPEENNSLSVSIVAYMTSMLPS